MPATQPSREFHALCHQHHVKMRLNLILLKSQDKDAQSLAYFCTEPNCCVHYSSSRGYFLLRQEGSASELDMAPSIRCPTDGIPMYLAEVNPENKSFRLWRCPQCDESQANEEGATAEAS